MRLILAFLICVSLASAQTAKDPVLSDATHAKIRDLQLQQESVKSQYLQLQAQLSKLEGQYNSLGVQVTKAMDEAYKESNVKPEEYSLQPDTLKFVKIEKQRPDEDACHGQFGSGTDADPCRALPNCREPKSDREKKACTPAPASAKKP